MTSKYSKIAEWVLHNDNNKCFFVHFMHIYLLFETVCNLISMFMPYNALLFDLFFLHKH